MRIEVWCKANIEEADSKPKKLAVFNSRTTIIPTKDDLIVIDENNGPLHVDYVIVDLTTGSMKVFVPWCTDEAITDSAQEEPTETVLEELARLRECEAKYNEKLQEHVGENVRLRDIIDIMDIKLGEVVTLIMRAKK